MLDALWSSSAPLPDVMESSSAPLPDGMWPSSALLPGVVPPMTTTPARAPCPQRAPVCCAPFVSLQVMTVVVIVGAGYARRRPTPCDIRHTGTVNARKRRIE